MRADIRWLHHASSKSTASALSSGLEGDKWKSLVLCFSLVWHLTEDWTEYIVGIYLLCRSFYVNTYARQQQQSVPHENTFDIAERVQQRVKNSRFRKGLIDCLVEFQKAQCWFVMAVQTACLVALWHPAYLAATSWQQLWSNFGVLSDLALGAGVTVVQSLLILRRCGSKDSYIFLISTAAVTLALAMWMSNYEQAYAAARGDPQDYIEDTNGISACGGHVCLPEICLSNTSQTDTS